MLVATDCLSEGVNLQDDFQAVVHYDLAWNPTRHEQREGRVDRFGQPAEIVRTATIYGEDNGIDGIVLNVLIRKHEEIDKTLGIRVPVPSRSDRVLAALVEGVLLRGKDEQLTLDFDADAERADLHTEWESSAAAEKLSRTRYAQRSIRDEDVIRELDAARAALGSPEDVAEFTRSALEECGAQVLPEEFGFTAEPEALPIGMRDALGRPTKPLAFHRDLPAPRGAAVLQRADARVAAVARYVLDAALDAELPASARPARRCGVVRTAAVSSGDHRAAHALPIPSDAAGPRRHPAPGRGGGAHTGVHRAAGPAAMAAARGGGPACSKPGPARTCRPRSPTTWPTRCSPVSTRSPPGWSPPPWSWPDSLREAHVRVRRAARGRQAGVLGVAGLTVAPQLPVDVLGVYVYLPVGGQR